MSIEVKCCCCCCCFFTLRMLLNRMQRVPFAIELGHMSHAFSTQIKFHKISDTIDDQNFSNFRLWCVYNWFNCHCFTNCNYYGYAHKLPLQVRNFRSRSFIEINSVSNVKSWFGKMCDKIGEHLMRMEFLTLYHAHIIHIWVWHHMCWSLA